ncbi:MAG TPA: DoxX-like family protein [Kofleriaceae bacterium]
MISLLPPAWLIVTAVAAVWFYEGLWCKLLGKEPNQLRVVQRVPGWGPRYGAAFLYALGTVEVALGLWVIAGFTPVLAAIAQTALLVTLNANGIYWSRDVIHDPAGMVVKNFSFLVLVWVAASLARGA